MRAAAEGENKEGPKLTFGTNANAARGYTEEDSAGQSNIFAVEVIRGRLFHLNSLNLLVNKQAQCNSDTTQ